MASFIIIRSITFSISTHLGVLGSVGITSAFRQHIEVTVGWGFFIISEIEEIIAQVRIVRFVVMDGVLASCMKTTQKLKNYLCNMTRNTGTFKHDGGDLNLYKGLIIRVTIS